MTSQKISAAILTFNSEKHLKSVLEKLYWCDEIVILDSYSTDETLEIANVFNAKIHQNKFENFGAQKQLLMSKCENDWIISIDSDEVLSYNLIENIKKLSASEFEKNAGFIINRKHIFLNKYFKYGKESNIYILRLFNKQLGGVTNNIVHERIKVKGTVSKIDGAMLHYTVDKLNEAIQKMDSYALLKATEYHKNNKKLTFIKLYITFHFTFFREYIFNRNFLNGYEGYLWAYLVAQGAALKYYYLKELYDLYPNKI